MKEPTVAETAKQWRTFTIMQYTTSCKLQARRKRPSQTLQKLKAKIVRLHHAIHQRLLLDNEGHDRIMDEDPSLYHTLKLRRRRESRMVDGTYDSEWTLQTSPSKILRTFTEFMKKYDTIQVDDESVHRMLRETCKTVPQLANDSFDAPITMDEL